MSLPSVLRDQSPPVELWPSVVWVIYETINEFGALGGIVAVASSESTANELAIGSGWWGGLGAIVKKSAFVAEDDTVWVLETPDALEVDTDLAKLRKEKLDAAQAKALEQFTPEERALLGLKLDDK
jgi:hypothetical protein